MSIKLYKLYVQGLQGYEDPTTFMFSDGFNIIRGVNSAGKSAIKRILKAYQKDISSEETLRGLLNRQSSYGYSDLTVINTETNEFTVVRLYLWQSTPKKISYYYEVFDNNLNSIFRQEYYTDQIAKYVGFESIPEPDGSFPLNFKDSVYNAFIDTPLLTNSYILDGLCYLAEYEVRISNIKDVIVKITDVKSEYSKELKMRNEDLSRETYTPTAPIEEQILSLQQLEKKLEESYNILNITTNCIENIQIQLDLERIQQLENLLNSAILKQSLKSLIDTENTAKLLETTSVFLDSKAGINEISDYENYNSQCTLVQFCIDLLDQKSTLKTSTLRVQHELNSSFLSSKILRLQNLQTSLKLKNDIENLISYIKSIQYIDFLIDTVESSKSRVKSRYIQFLQNISEEGMKVCGLGIETIESYTKYLNFINLKTSIINDSTLDHYSKVMDIMQERLSILNDIKIIRETSEDIEYVNSALELIPKCPTCGRAAI